MPFDGSELPTSLTAQPELPVHYRRSSLLAALHALLRPARPARSLAGGDQVLPEEVRVVQLLCAAQALIEVENKWTQGRYQTFGGRRCAMGALRAAARSVRDPRAFEGAKKLLAAEAISRGYTHIEKMNDCSTHPQVLSAFDAAIAKARILAE
jgi:hypothetical protein